MSGSMDQPHEREGLEAKHNISTLVLVHEVEYELQAAPGSICFPSWGSHEAQNKNRLVQTTLSLLPQGLLREESTQGSVPLVITPPLTSRFRLITEGLPLNSVLRVGAPITFSVEFIPPRDSKDEDFEWPNFQDQITIQTRLAKLSLRLAATRDAASIEACKPESFLPRSIPNVKAPSLKFFDQIERDSMNKATNAPSAASKIATSVSGSFHPHKSSGNQIGGLDPLPRRQPTPPQSTCLSRPASCNPRTPSPRILEPLPVAQAPNVTTEINNDAEARAVILRLRARRASQQYEPTKTQSASITEQLPTCPESQLDGKTPAELEEFDALVRAAKLNVAVEVDKAKEELDFYKAFLPTAKNTGHGVSDILPTSLSVSRPAKLPPGELRKSTKLPALDPHCSSTRTSTTSSCHEKSNQDLSPVKSAPVKQVKKTVSAPEPETVQLKETKPRSTKTLGQPRENAATVKPRQSVPRASLSSKHGSPSVSQSATETNKKSKAVPAAVKTTKKTAKTTTKVPVGVQDDALLDFDDADPDVDHAPVLPDDLCSRQEEEDEDPMLTMKVPF